MAESPQGTVLLIGPVAPPHGGMASSLVSLHHALTRAGVSVRVLRTNPRLGVFESIPVVRTVLSFTAFVVQLLVIAPRCRAVHLLAASHWYFRLRCAPVLLLARFLGRRVIVQYKGGLLSDFLRSGTGCKRWLLRRAHVLAVPSPYLARALAEHGLGSIIIPNIAELERFTWRERRSFRPHLLVARSLEALYGIDTVLKAFALLRRSHPDAELHIAGDGSLRASLAAVAGPGVTFHGALDSSALAALHQQCDVMVNASRADNMPVSLMEAMTTGLAIVSTNAGGIPDLVRHGHEALLVPVDDADALCAAVASVLQDSAGAADRAARARTAALAFSGERVVALLLQHYGLQMR